MTCSMLSPIIPIPEPTRYGAVFQLRSTLKRRGAADPSSTPGVISLTHLFSHPRRGGARTPAHRPHRRRRPQRSDGDFVELPQASLRRSLGSVRLSTSAPSTHPFHYNGRRVAASTAQGATATPR